MLRKATIKAEKHAAKLAAKQTKNGKSKEPITHPEESQIAEVSCVTTLNATYCVAVERT